jgi:hypothetical protein
LYPLLWREGHVRPETHAEYAVHAPDGITPSVNIGTRGVLGETFVAGGTDGVTFTWPYDSGSWWS